MSNSLARKTIAKIEQALEDGQSTAISEIIQIIQELACRAFSISVSELSELIGRDPTITEKVISAANTLGFNPSGVPIHTISESIHTVGFEKIRNLAISLLLAESAGQNLNSFEQREIAALSVCSGLLAQSLVRERRSQTIDAELLFVCSSLRNYGKLLMSSFLVEQYREAKSLALEMDSDAAFRHVFGLTPLALGRYLLQSTNLPRSIMACLRDVPKETLERVAESDEDELLVIAELCAKICDVAFNEHIGPDQFNDAVVDVLSQFQITFPVSLESINFALIKAESDFSLLNRAIGLKDEASPATQKLRARVAGDPLPLPPAASRIKPREKPKAYAEMNAEERESFAEDSFQRAMGKIAEKMVPGERIDLQEVYQLACHTIMEGLNLENCMAFVREDFDPNSMSARYGYGPLFEKIKNRPLVSPRNKDIFTICLSRKEDVLIQDTRTGKIQSVIPEWIHARGEAGSFTVLPTLLNKRLFAIIVGTVSQGRIIEISEGDRRRLRMARARLANVHRMIQEKSLSLV